MAVSDARAKELIDVGNKLFSKKQSLDSLWQELAHHFYPERADFTQERSLGRDWNDHQLDSHPVMMRRELGNSISSMLRPRNRQWFRTSTLDDDLDKHPPAAQFLDYLTNTMRRQIYQPKTNFIRATKEGDHDFITFGQTVLSIEEDVAREIPQFKCHHLKNCAWLENQWQKVDHLHFKDRMTARAMVRMFGEKNVHQSVKDLMKTDPGAMVDIRRCVMPSDEYDYNGHDLKKGGKKLPFVAIYYDATNNHMLRESPLAFFPFIVPRWHTISGYQYAFSPATTTALPDARMVQQLAMIIMEAGEKAIDPPMIATEEAVGEVNLQAGAVTWADFAYDERLGAAVRAIDIRYDIQAGFAMRQDLREMLAKAFFIDKLNLPDSERDMTAFEVGRRLEEHVRQLLPLFEPMEVDYNTQLLDASFAVLNNLNKFDWSRMPPELQDVEFSYEFESPVQEGMKRIKMSQFREAIELYVSAKQVDPAAINPFKMNVALTDAAHGIGTPNAWRKSDEEMEQEGQMLQQQAMMEKAMQQASAGAEIAGQVGDAAQKLTPQEPAQIGQDKMLALPPPANEDPDVDADAVALIEALSAIPDEEIAA